MPDIVLTADKTVMINYRLTCLGGFIACIPRGSLPKGFAKYAEKRLFLPAPSFVIQPILIDSMLKFMVLLP